jgi:hypothetical protein
MGYEDMTTSSVILGDNPTRVSLAIDAWLYGEFVLLVQEHVKAQLHPNHVACCMLHGAGRLECPEQPSVAVANDASSMKPTSVFLHQPSHEDLHAIQSNASPVNHLLHPVCGLRVPLQTKKGWHEGRWS